MIHIDRRHPEIDRAANPIRQLRYSASILNHKNNNTFHDASNVATPIHNIMADRLLRQYEEDRRDELIAKRQERERIHSRELIDGYYTILKVNDIENQKRMGGTFRSGAKNEIFNLWIAGVITPVMTIDGEGIIWIRNELKNRENNSKSLAANQNDLDNRQSQDLLTVIVAQAEFNCNFIKFVEERKRNLDVRDEELVKMFFGAAKGSQASITKV